MKTLEDMFRERMGGDSRAANAVIDVRKEGVRILLGAVGNLGRIILGVEGDEVKVLFPTKEQLAEADEAEEAGEGDATNVRRIPDIAAGEFVDDRDPLKPGENPLDAPARIENEGLSARQPEAVTATTGVFSTMPVDTSVAGDGAPAGSSEVKNPQDGGEGVGSNGGAQDGNDGKPAAVNPDAQSKDELLALAKAEGVEVKSGDTKAAIASAINAKRGEAASQ